MSDTPEHDRDPVGDEVQWYRDPDGTEWFVDDDVRFELSDDGFAYPVVGGVVDPSGAVPLEVVVDDDLDDVDWPEPNAVDAGDADDTDDAAGDAATPSPFAPDATTRIVAVRTDEQPAAAVEEVAVEAPVAASSPATAAPATAAPVSAGRVEPSASDVEPLLNIRALDAGYGTLPVLKGVDLQIRPGETAVLLGLNGAGKTTTAWAVCGALAPWGGEILFDGKDVGGWSTADAVENGVVMVPEGRRVFGDLSVGRNLQVGAWGKRSDSDWVTSQRDRVFDYFPRLREREDQLAGTLSGGEQQMLAMGRGLMAGPRLLIVDEASMGLAPVIVKDVFDIIAQINDDGVTVLLIEQNVGALDVADLGYVMEQGRMVRVLEGEELRDRSVVSAALMG